MAKHGHFTWGDDAKESYDWVTDQTNKVEEWLAQHRAQRSMQVKKPQVHEQQDFLLKLRGALVDCSDTAKTPVIFNVIQTEDTLRFLCRNDVSMHAKAGVATPDHVIRTKARPLLLASDVVNKSSRVLLSMSVPMLLITNPIFNVAPSRVQHQKLCFHHYQS